MTINERIKLLRKDLGKNQKDFGAAIGLTQAGISYIEQAGSNISDSTIKSICKTFNVNETWLRTGDGETFQQDKQSTIERMAEEYQLTDLERSIFTSYLELNSEARTAIMGYVTNLTEKLEVAKTATQLIPSVSSEESEPKAEPSKPIGNSDKLPTSEPVATADLVARLDALERKNAALEQEVAQARQKNEDLQQKIQAMEEEERRGDIVSCLYTSFGGSSSSTKAKQANKSPPST